MNKCIFCDLINKNNHCFKIFEDEFTFAFMDKFPVNPGHILIIPKKHISNFEDLNDEIYQKIMFNVHKISKVVKSITKCKKVGILVSGFDIDHAHVHIIPMNNIKDVATKRIWENEPKEASEKELEHYSNKISKEL